MFLQNEEDLKLVKDNEMDRLSLSSFAKFLFSLAVRDLKNAYFFELLFGKQEYLQRNPSFSENLGWSDSQKDTLHKSFFLQNINEELHEKPP